MEGAVPQPSAPRAPRMPACMCAPNPSERHETVDLFAPSTHQPTDTARDLSAEDTGRLTPLPVTVCCHCDAAADGLSPRGWVAVSRKRLHTFGVCPTCLAARYPFARATG